MIETNSTSKTTSLMNEVRAQIGIVPVIRRNIFVYGMLVLLFLYGLLLPSVGSPTNNQMIMIWLFVLLCVGWAVVVLTDQLKPEWFKMVTAISLLILGGWLFYRYSAGQWSQMAFLFFNMRTMKLAWPTMLMGMGVTIKIAIFAAMMSTVLGLLLAVFRSFNNRVLNIFIIGYVDFFRAMPIIVLMVFIYYALPYLGVTLDAVLSGILALGLNSSAYVSEIFRAGILSVKKGQLEAAHALGLTSMQTMRLVLLPQAFRVVLPPLVGNYVASAKDTALCSSISIIELLKAGLSEQALLANPSPLIFSTVLYLMMFVPLTRLASMIETRMKQSQRKVNM